MMDMRVVLQYQIPDKCELKLAQAPVKEEITGPYEHGFFDGPGNAVCLTSHNGKLATLL